MRGILDNMGNELFRQKSLEKIQSPDNLKEYIKVINPGFWIVLIAVFLLLTGAFVWGYAGKVEDKISVTAVCKDGVVVCEVNNSAEVGMRAVVDGNEGVVSSVTDNFMTIELEKTISDGVYPAYVVAGVISPISFVFN